MASITATLDGPCSCCGGGPVNAPCALQMPGMDVFSWGSQTEYADYATALAAMENASCFSFGFSTVDLVATPFTGAFTSTFVNNELTVSASTNPSGMPLNNFRFSQSITVDAGTLTITFSTSGLDANEVVIFDAATGLQISDDFVSPASSPFTTALTTGTYVVMFLAYYPSPTTTTSFSFVATHSAMITVNPVILIYDDSGTTRQLWACPKLLLPPLTEAPPYNQYVDCAEAALQIATYTSDCVGFQSPSTGIDNTLWSATDHGTSIDFNAPSSPGGLSDCWCSVNALASETINISYSGGTNLSGGIYDDTGTLIEPISDSGGAFVSSSLTANGRYTVNFNVFTPFPGTVTFPLDASVSSSGTMSSNPIQAMYDVGLSCSGRLNCGDACP